MDATKAALRARYGPEALLTRVGTVWVVHLDQPSQATIHERLAEVQRELLEPADCPLCELARPRAGDTLIYDGEMCLHEPAPGRDWNPQLN